MNPETGIRNIIRPGGEDGPSAGFTLIELIVVIALMGVMLFFSLPRLQANPFDKGVNRATHWLIGRIGMLRENAVRNGKNCSLHLDLDAGRIWETSAAMTPQEVEQAALEDNFRLPADVRLVDVQYAAGGKQNSGQAQITFYRTGYADKVLIHLQENGTYRSLLVEPFLSEVVVFQKYAGFDD